MSTEDVKFFGKVGWIDRWVDGEMNDGWLDGWRTLIYDGLMGGEMDGWM